jgi:primosomal protein N'
MGVTTLARDVAAQLGQKVSEVTATTELNETFERVVVGTEAVWQRVRHCGVVIFADFDQYLLAPRDSARRSAITAVGKAGRLVGPRREGRGAVVLHTRRGDDAVIEALVQEKFDAIIDDDVATARLLQLAPYGAEAEVTGEGAASFVAELSDTKVSVSTSASGFIIRANDVTTLTTTLRSAARPLGKVRVAVR